MATPMHVAARYNNWKYVAWLVEKGSASVNIANSFPVLCNFDIFYRWRN